MRINPSGLYCAYLRKSRRDEELEALGQGETLSRHAQALAALAERLGIRIARTYRELVSGDTIQERPEVRRLLDDINAGLWDGVLVMDVDRLGRGDSIDQGVIMQSFMYSNTLIITPDKTYDPSDESDAEFFEIKLFFSRREYNMIKKRLQRGRLASVMEGNYMGGGVPFGYTPARIPGKKGATLAVVPEKAELVRAMFSWYLAGDGTRIIAGRLNDMGMTTDRGLPWTTSTVLNVLHNPTYIGKVRWNQRQTVYRIEDGRRVASRPRSDGMILVDGKHEAIVTPEIFDAVQRRFKSSPFSHVNVTKHPANPLRGLVICGICGKTMQRKPNANTKDARRDDFLHCTTLGCPTCYAYIHVVEDAILEALEGWHSAAVAPESASSAADDAQAYAVALRQLEAQKAATEAQQGRLYDLLEQGVYTIDIFRQRHDELLARMADIDARIAALGRPARPDPRAALAAQAQTVVETYRATPDPEARNALLRTVIDHVVYHKTQRNYRNADPGAGLSVEVYPRMPEDGDI